eukprot:m.137843 g.137843  ORF g.137843 m.137843 type:complete len:77 (+) comp14765_c0_seq1:1039-1269(+)
MWHFNIMFCTVNICSAGEEDQQHFKVKETRHGRRDLYFDNMLCVLQFIKFNLSLTFYLQYPFNASTRSMLQQPLML